MYTVRALKTVNDDEVGDIKVGDVIASKLHHRANRDGQYLVRVTGTVVEIVNKTCVKVRFSSGGTGYYDRTYGVEGLVLMEREIKRYDAELA